MNNGIKYLKTEEYTPQQISNPKLNLNFEPINPVETISGYQRLYRSEDSSQQSSENSEVLVFAIYAYSLQVCKRLSMLVV